MLSEPLVIAAAKKALPGRVIELLTPYKNLYIINATDPSDDIEGDYDSFYSVSNTGEVKEFSIIYDIDPNTFMDLVDKAKAQ